MAGREAPRERDVEPFGRTFDRAGIRRLVRLRKPAGLFASRLDEACWRIGRRDRLSVVLRRSTEALLAAQSVTVVLVVILAAIAGVRVVSELSNDAGPSRWVGTVAEPLVLLAGFVLLFFLLANSTPSVSSGRTQRLSIARSASAAARSRLAMPPRPRRSPAAAP